MKINVFSISDENSSIVDEFMEASVKGDDEEDKEQAVEVEGKIVVVPLSDGTEEIRLQRGGTFLRLELEKSDLSDFSYFSGMVSCYLCYSWLLERFKKNFFLIFEKIEKLSN